MSELVVSGLVRKRSEVAGEIAELEARIVSLRAGLAHLDGALRVFGHEVVEAAPAKRSRAAPSLFAPNERQRFIGAALRENPDGVTTPELAERLMAAKGMDAADARLRNAVTAQLANILARLERRGLVVRGALNGTARVWRIPAH